MDRSALSVPAGEKPVVLASASKAQPISPFSSYLNAGLNSPTPPGHGNPRQAAVHATGDAVFEIFLDAIEYVESRCDPTAIGQLGEVGSFQIGIDYLDDVNHICKQQRFEYDQRYERVASRQMTRIYLQHYGKGKTLEQMARIHNGGPTGWKKKSTEKYWEKVDAAMRRMVDGRYLGHKSQIVDGGVL
jgi:hypothetical protein